MGALKRAENCPVLPLTLVCAYLLLHLTDCHPVPRTPHTPPPSSDVLEDCRRMSVMPWSMNPAPVDALGPSIKLRGALESITGGFTDFEHDGMILSTRDGAFEDFRKVTTRASRGNDHKVCPGVAVCSNTVQKALHIVFVDMKPGKQHNKVC